MLAQRVSGFQHEAERSSGGLTCVAGLPLYLHPVQPISLGSVIARNGRVADSQGWLVV
jgi:hypothetical protein